MIYCNKFELCSLLVPNMTGSTRDEELAISCLSSYSQKHAILGLGKDIEEAWFSIFWSLPDLIREIWLTFH